MAMRRQEQQQNSRRPISCPSFCGRYNFKRIRPRAQSLLPRAVVDYFSVKDREMYFLFVLGIAYVVADYVFMVLITILTDEWQLKLDQAVTITNIQEASKSTLMVLCAYLTDCRLGNSTMLGIAALIYGTGVLVLGLTYPHFTPEEIFQCQTTDFCPKKPMPFTLYLGLVLITFGQCGSILYGYRGRQEVEEVEKENHEAQNWVIVVLKELREVPYNGCKSNEPLKKIWEILRKKIDWIYVIGMILAIFAFPHIDNIYLPLTFMLWGGCSWFAFGKALFYECDKPLGSPLSVFGGVIGLACCKESVDDEAQTCVCIEDEDDDPSARITENDNTQNHSNSNRLSEDDGAAGYESSPSEVHHLYEHRDVNDTDIELNKIPCATPEAHNPSNTVEMKDSQNVDDYKKKFPRLSEDDEATSYGDSPSEVHHHYEHRDVNDNHHHETAIELSKISSATPEAHNLANTNETEEGSQNDEKYKEFSNYLSREPLMKIMLKSLHIILAPSSNLFYGVNGWISF